MKQEIKKRKSFFLCVVAALLFLSFIAFKWDSVFQRGNPIPYFTAAVTLSDNHAYAAVDGMEGVYITRQGDKDSLFQMIQDTYNVAYKDQLGSSYLFSDGKYNYNSWLRNILGKFYCVDIGF